MIYRGWFVLAGGFISALLMVGSTIYCFGLFVVPAIQEFGLSRANANNGQILFSVGLALWAPFVGRLIDKLPIGTVMAFGGLLLAGGFVVVALTHALWLIGLAAIGPIALGVVCAGGIAGNTAVTRWFRRRRGRAIGILAVASSTGNFVMTPIAAYLIEHFGWRTAIATIGVTAGLIVAILAAVLVRSRPTEQQLREGTELEEPKPSSSVVERTWSARQILTMPNFWFIAIGAGILFASDATIIATLPSYLHDAGVSLQMAGIFLAATALSAMSGKLLIGFLTERINVKGLFVFVAAIHLCYLGLLLLHPSYGLLLAGVSVVGVGVGGVIPVWANLIAANFGANSFGSVMGWANFAMQPITILYLRVIGESHDRTGSYNLAFIVFSGAILIAIWLILSIRRPVHV